MRSGPTIAIAATFTAEPVEDTLAFWIDEAGLASSVVFVPYNQVFQQLLNPGSLFAMNSGGVNVILLRLEDWRPADGSDASLADDMARNVNDLVDAVRTSAERSHARHIVCVCPASPAATADADRAALFDRLENRLRAGLTGAPGATLLSGADLALYPVADTYDPHGDALGHVPYTPLFFTALGTALARRIHAMTYAPAKVIVTDCDQTIWQGVCAEDGPSGIAVDPPRRALQEFLVRQHDAGVLICLCSKNAEDDIAAVFRTHPDMPLKPNHIVAQRINWRPKSENIHSLAEELNLGLDSFVFLDDNPLECAEVRLNCPNVLTLQLPEDPRAIPDFVKHVWVFDRLERTATDAGRTQLYRQNLEREQYRRASAGFREFLEGLNLHIDVFEPGAEHVPRIAQLTQRTNQFNFTTIRRSEEDLRAALLAGARCRAVTVKDRFGDYGLVGAMLYRENDGSLETDTFLLSCRALGRGVEHRMLAALGALAREHDIKEVRLRFQPTARNRPAADFLDAIESARKEPDDDGFVYIIGVDAAEDAVRTAAKTSGRVAPSERGVREVPEPTGGSNAEHRRAIARIAAEFRDPHRILTAVERRRGTRARALDTPCVAPSGSTETRLAGIWQKALHLDRLGVHDRFVELGGDSLLAVEILSRIRTLFGVDLPLSLFFENPSVRALAREIESLRDQKMDERSSAAWPALRPAPQDRCQPFPLTEIQQAYWIGRTGTFEIGNVSTHIYVEYESDDMDLDRLTAAIRQLIERHDMLRAVILPSGQQQVLPNVPPYEVETFDLRGKPAAQLNDELEQRRHEMSHRVLPSDQWPLFEVKASRLGDRRVRIHAGFDALIADAFSLQILLKELHRLYSDPEAALPPIEPTFRDYILTTAALLDSPPYEASRAYWLDRLPALPPAPELPLARTPAAIAYPRFACLASRLDRKRWTRLKERAAQSGMTPSGILLAAFADVIRLWSKTSRFTVNLTLFNRLPLHPQINDVVGDFTSVTLLAADDPAERSFRQRAHRTQQQFWKDLDHRHFSGVEVLREMARRADGAPRAVMPVVFTSILANDLQSEDPELLTWMGDVVYGVAQTPQVWLDHIVLERGGELIVNWHVVEGLFPAGLAEEMFESYRAFLSSLADDENTWRESWPHTCARLLPPAQREMLAAANDTAAPVPEGLLHARFAEQAARQPDAPAVIGAERTLTYGELFRRANRLGRLLRELGARPNTLVAVVMEKGWEQVVGTLGILSAGAAYLPIEAGVPPERLQHLLERGEVAFALTQSRLDGGLAWPEGVRRIRVDGPEADGLDDTPLDAVQTAEDLAYVIFTSGSTGTPKGVMIDHRGALNTVVDVNSRFDVGPEDRVLALSSLSFDLSVYDIFGTLAAGGAIVMPAPAASRDPSRWAHLIAEHGVTVWNSVPALMDLLVEYLAGLPAAPSCASLRLILMSGDWIPVTLPDQIRAHIGDVRMISMGGATEASIWSIIYPIEGVDPAWKSIPYGRAMANQQFHVLNDALAPCPVWAPGQLYIGGIGLAKGYWRDEEKTQASFIVHPRTGERLYRTGDLGRWLPHGNIEFMGREDFQVKIQGFRVELEEIEYALLQHPDLSAAVVAAVGEDHREKRLAAYVVPSDRAAPPTIEALRDFVRRKVPPYMAPSAFLILDRLPLTPNGKVDRKALPAPADLATEPVAGTPAAETDHEARIAALAARVMEIDIADPHTNLLTLGATSIHMIRIANLLEKELGFRPRMDAFYAEPTVASLAAAFMELQQESRSAGDARPAPATAPLTQPAQQFELLLDPDERHAFKDSRPGLRTFDGSEAHVALPAAPLDEEVRRAYRERRSHRCFAAQPLALRQLSRLLGCLRRARIDGEERYRYGSAGGLYPVQTYLFVKPDRVADLDAGTYYYDPALHRLVALTPGGCIARGAYDPIINTPIFDTAAVAIFFVAQLAAIGPMYGDQSLHYAAVEAGLMAQLLEMEAPRCAIGLCQIGELEFEPMRDLFKLTATHRLVHSMLGGPLVAKTESAPGATPTSETRPAPVERRPAPSLRPVNRSRPLPLSYAQEGLWLTVQASAMPPFNHPLAFRIRGSLDLAALERAFNAIAQRHEILRACCEIRDGRPTLAIRGSCTLDGFVHDLRESEAAHDEEKLRTVAEEEVRRPFDLEHGPLFRAGLWRMGERDFLLLVTLHTFVADGVSHGILLRELSRCYRAFAGASDAGLPDHAIQFADYAAWQRETVESGAWDEQLAYWKERLREAPQEPRWPVERRRTDNVYGGRTIHFNLPLALSDALRNMARREGVTLFALLLATVHVLLHRLTGQTRTLVGTTVSNRSHSELEDLIGYFANNLPLDALVAPNLSFQSLVKQCHLRAAEALGRQDYPFERLVRELAVDPAFPHVPGLHVVFVLHDHVAEQDLDLPGVSLEVFPLERGTASFDLYLRMADVGGPLHGSLEFSTAVFDRATADRLVERWAALLEEIVREPGVTIDALQSVGQTCVDALVEAWRAAQPEPAAAPAPAARSRPRGDDQAPLADASLAALVSDVWRDVLNVDTVHPSDNFFELGAKSMHVIQVHGKLQARLQREIPVVSLFQYPTVRDLCRHLGDSPPPSPTAAAPAADRGARLRAMRQRRGRSNGGNRKP